MTCADCPRNVEQGNQEYFTTHLKRDEKNCEGKHDSHETVKKALILENMPVQGECETEWATGIAIVF
jgi:hypothetical protein